MTNTVPSWPKIRSKFQKRISMKNWNLTNILLCTYIFWNYYFSTSRQAKISAINKVKILYYFIIFMEICMVLFHTGRQATYSLVSDRQASKGRPKADNAASSFWIINSNKDLFLSKPFSSPFQHCCNVLQNLGYWHCLRQFRFQD